MVRAEWLHLRGGHQHLLVTGHAGAGRFGEDLVCAAVSALVETWRLGFERVVPGAGRCRVEAGHALFCWDEQSAAAQAIAATMMAGLADLAESHGRFVQFSEVSRQAMNDTAQERGDGGAAAVVCP